MRLRTFLIRRGIQTVVTLLIVLVLLFVVFRLMPGDPTRFVLGPGVTPDVRDRLLVEYGLKKYEAAAGVFHEGKFGTDESGSYLLTITAMDVSGNRQNLYATFYKSPSGGSGIVTIQPDAIAGRGLRSELLVPRSGEVPVRVNVISSSAIAQSWARVTGEGGGFDTNVTLASSDGVTYEGTLTLLAAGFYRVNVTALDQDGNAGTLVYFLAVNALDSDLVPFRLVREPEALDAYYEATTRWRPSADGVVGEVGTFQDPGQAQFARVLISTTSSSGNVVAAIATVATPDPTQEPISVTLSHPIVIVDRPIVEQFWTYYIKMLFFDFGTSIPSYRPVWSELQEKIPYSVLLFGTASILGTLLGIAIGVFLAWRRGSKTDLAAIIVGLFFYSMPLFWLGLIMLWIFAFNLGWFPLTAFGGGFGDIAGLLRAMTLPLITLTIAGLGGNYLFMRGVMLEVLGEDYITTARAKGLGERTVMYRHAARNAMLPVVTSVALGMSSIVSGGVLTETIFSWNGMGQYLITNTLGQNYAAVQGAFYLLAIITILSNLVADVLYAFLDPRVRL